MAGADAQGGFYYQNIVAASYVLTLIETGSRYNSIILENPQLAKYIDDIIVKADDKDSFIQVKYSEDDSFSFTLINLLTSAGDSISLLGKLVRGFKQIAEGDHPVEVVLFSNRRAGTRLGKYKKSLRDFISEFQKPFNENPDVTDIEQAELYDEYAEILDCILEQTDLRDPEELSRFLKCLRFEFGQPDRETMRYRVLAQLATLGLDKTQFYKLTDAIVNWSISRQEVDKKVVLKELGLDRHFAIHVSQEFPVDEELWVPTPALFDKISESLKTLDRGFVFLEGEPGSGKSTALSMYRRENPGILFGYYCFVPNDESLGNDRLRGDIFTQSICISLRNAFPHFEFPNPWGELNQEQLNNWLSRLSKSGLRVIFVVDGLDHVHRKSRETLEQPLTNVLDATLPKNVLIVLSSQYPDVLPSAVREHIESDPKRHIQVPGFTQDQVFEFFRRRGVNLSGEFLRLVCEITRGVPLILDILASQLQGMSKLDQKTYLESAPTLRGEKIDHYFRYLWADLESDPLTVHILAFLAALNEFITPETLKDVLTFVRPETTLLEVHQTLRRTKHLLRVSDAKSWAIKHNSFADFVNERTSDIQKEIAVAMTSWYEQHPNRDETWRHQFRHAVEAGEYTKVLEICDGNWLERAWKNFRPIYEIQRNLDYAWQAASFTHDVLEFVRISLLKQTVALVDHNIGLSENELAVLLLDMGRDEEATRRVWDGERRKCSPTEFAEFALSYRKSRGKILPRRIIEAGLGEAPDPGSDVQANIKWYCAKSHVGNPVELLRRIEDTVWQTKPLHGRYTRETVTDIEGAKINTKIQMAVVREYAERGIIDALESIRDSDRVGSIVRATASAAICLILTLRGVGNEAKAELGELNLSEIPDDFRNALYLELPELVLNDVPRTAPAPRPRLPTSLSGSERSGVEFNDDIYALYDQLRIYFLQEDTGFPWFEATTTGLTEPVKTVVSAIGRLAWLWVRNTRELVDGDSAVAIIEGILEGLDPPTYLFEGLDRRFDFTEGLYRRSAYVLFEQVWSCITSILTEADVALITRLWLRGRDGKRAVLYPKATLALAEAVYNMGDDDVSKGLIRNLIEIVEVSVRENEEASSATNWLVACASAWGRCGFSDEADRVWADLLNIGCGVYWRKDYQFNYIITALEFAHNQDPEGSINRVREQLTLAHKLDGVTQAKTVATAIGGLIEFISKIDPRVALKALSREEELVFRDVTLSDIVRVLAENTDVDRRFVLALAETLDRWEDYRWFNDQTKPAMFSVYSAALKNDDIGTAINAYEFWRYVLLVEKDMPEELGRWAELWISLGNAPLEVSSDYAKYPPKSEEGADTRLYPGASSERERWAEELEGFSGDVLSELETIFDEACREETRKGRLRELDSTRPDIKMALAKAACREEEDIEDKHIDVYFGELTDKAMDAPLEGGLRTREILRQAFNEFVVAISDILPVAVTAEDFEGYFDVEGWLDSLVRTVDIPLSLDEEVRSRLPGWVKSAPSAALEEWEAFYRQRCRSGTKAVGLYEVACRWEASDPDRAVTDLVEAWEALGKYLESYGELGHIIFTKLLEFDKEKSIEVLFEGFRREYQKYPESIIYQLDNLLKFVAKTSSFDALKLYDIWSEYNKRLVAGIIEKPSDLGWLTNGRSSTFENACLSYLIELFDYPVVGLRLLAQDALFRLLTERVELIEVILDTWGSLTDGQKEYVTTLMFSVFIYNTGVAERFASRLVKLGQHENHRNLRITIDKSIEVAAQRGADIPTKTLACSRGLVESPRIISRRLPQLEMKAGEKVQFPKYIEWMMNVLGKGAPGEELKKRFLTELSRLYPRLEEGLKDEYAVYQEYNINTNFDLIEIEGEFGRETRSALNRAIQSLVETGQIEFDFLQYNEDILRLSDPTDNLVKRVIRPDRISWINDGLTDDEFLEFADVGGLQAHYDSRDPEWITLFENTEQRTGERLSPDTQRANLTWVITFGIPRGGTVPTVDEAYDEIREGSLSRFRNLYRYELARSNAPPSVAGFFPLVVITRRAFRGTRTLDLAALNHSIAEEVGFLPAAGDEFGYNMNGHKAVRSIEWQEAFDQGRRRHKPKSEGFLLEIKRDILERIADNRRMEVWAYISIRRSIDRYKPECQMDWRTYKDVFRIPLLNARN